MLWRVEGGSDNLNPSILALRRSLQPACHSPLLRLACRDIGGSDPERMAAPRVADYVQQLFENSPVEVEELLYVTTESHSRVFIVRTISADIRYSS